MLYFRAKPTVKQNLAAIRMLFDWLVIGGILATNSATLGVVRLAIGV
jgi:hypothetical protein